MFENVENFVKFTCFRLFAVFDATMKTNEILVTIFQNKLKFFFENSIG